MELSNIKFNLVNPKISFGNGKINELGLEILTILKPLEINKPKALIVSGIRSLRESGYLEKIKNDFANLNIHLDVYDKVDKEPTTRILNNGRDLALQNNNNIIIGIGGGSVLDTTKGIAGLVTNSGNAEEYLQGKQFIKPTLPFILCPTTAGTGSEVSNNSVIIDEEKKIKLSIRGLWAHLALLDPELTLSLTKKYTAYPGADALVQAIEALVSKGSNFISDFFAKKSIELLGQNLPKVCDDLINLNLREKMMLGSLLDGIAFANGKLGAVHGFAHPIGIIHDIPHGLICGLLLPYVMEYNCILDYVIEKYAWIAELFYRLKVLPDYGECPQEIPIDKKGKAKWIIQKVKDIFRYIGIPLHLRDVGIKESAIDEIVKNTKGSSLDNNPRDTDKNSLKEILLNAL